MRVINKENRIYKNPTQHYSPPRFLQKHVPITVVTIVPYALYAGCSCSNVKNSADKKAIPEIVSDHHH